MDIWPFSSNEDSEDEVVDPDLSDLQSGWIVEHIEGTLEVTDKVTVTYDGYFDATEWSLERSDGTLYFLEREEDDQVFWGLYREGGFNKAPNLRENIDRNSTPPREISYGGKNYTRFEYGDAVRKTDQGRENLLYATYEASDGTYLALEVYDSNEVELWIGEEVSETEFDILPE